MNELVTPHHEPQKQKPPSAWRELRNLLIKISAVLLVLSLISAFMFGIYKCPDNSMSQSIHMGDLVLVNRWDHDYAAGDVLVLKYKGQRQMRRVIAVAGDTVNITEEGLFINGAQQQELKAYGLTHQYEKGPSFPLTVGKGQVFVLADARTNAADSRVYGTINISDTQGKLCALFRNRDI